jgi:putative membrane protein
MQPPKDHGHEMRWMWYGLGAMFVLIGVAVFLGIFYTGASVQTTYPMIMFPFDFGWVWNIVGILFFLWILSWVFGWGWWGSRGYRYRRWYRYDDAYQILRERYAKGEITKEQFEQMMRDLQPQGQ